MATKPKPKITTLVPWFGSNRLHAHKVGELLSDCNWVGIPFAGGMCEISHIEARTILVNDLHHELINLANVVSEDVELLQKTLRSKLFHPDTLEYSRDQLRKANVLCRVNQAANFFVVCWMTRAGTAGTKAEKTAKLALRWSAGVVDSVVRYQSAIDGLPYWSRQFKRCTFSCLDFFEFLLRCNDLPRSGIYADPPFIDKGKKYLHNCGKTSEEQEACHVLIAKTLERFSQARVVVRAYDCEFIREVYDEKDWTWHEFTGRKQTNDDALEVLLVRN